MMIEELFVFLQGARGWYFTSAAQEILYQSRKFVPTAIKRSEVRQSSEVFKNAITLEFPARHTFAGNFLHSTAEEVTTLTVLRKVDDAVATYWKGRVVSAKADGSVIKIECESVFTSLRRQGLRALYLRSCRHGLYSSGCGVSMAAHERRGTVQSVNGQRVLLAQSVGNDLAGGIIKTQDGVPRYIRAQNGAELLLSRALDIAVGEAVFLYPGCDLQMQTCINHFNNLDNFGGFPWIPSKTPFEGNIAT